MDSLATVCIPWRPTPDRIPVHDRCVKFWTDNQFPVIEADSDPEKPFLCNQARNNAVRRARTPVVIICDADMIVDDIAQIHTAVEHALQGSVVWPYTVDRNIPADRDQPLHQAPVIFEQPIDIHTGALIVISRETFWSIGAYDERFTPGVGGWDDVAFVMCAATLLKVVRVEGVAWSFRLPDAGFSNATNRHNPNRPRCALYSHANRKGEKAMRELLATRPEVPRPRVE